MHFFLLFSLIRFSPFSSSQLTIAFIFSPIFLSRLFYHFKLFTIFYVFLLFFNFLTFFFSFFFFFSLSIFHSWFIARGERKFKKNSVKCDILYHRGLCLIWIQIMLFISSSIILIFHFLFFTLIFVIFYPLIKHYIH